MSLPLPRHIRDELNFICGAHSIKNGKHLIKSNISLNKQCPSYADKTIVTALVESRSITAVDCEVCELMGETWTVFLERHIAVEVLAMPTTWL